MEAGIERRSFGFDAKSASEYVVSLALVGEEPWFESWVLTKWESRSVYPDGMRRLLLTVWQR